MKNHNRQWQWQVLTFACIALLAIFLSPISTPAGVVAYLDPSLAAAPGNEPVSVIVTAVSTDTAAAAVNAIDGQITSRLGLINAVGAILTHDQINTLADTAGIVSIVNNHAVTASGGPDCSGGPTDHGPCALPPGWVTDHREKKEDVELPVSLNRAAALAQLPGGGFVAAAEKQYVAFLNPDGSFRLLLDHFQFEKLSTPPVVTTDGIVYLMGKLSGSDDKFIIYAIDSVSGEILWENSKQKNLVQGLAISPDEQFIYVLGNETKAKLYIFAAGSGDLLEKAEPPTDKPGIFSQPPLVAADGTVYLQSTGNEPDKDDRFANVIAIDPVQSLSDDKAYRWRFEAAFATPIGEDDLFELDMAPLLANGSLYLFSDKDKVVFALDPETGALMYRFDMPKSLEDAPMVGADGTLYLPADNHFYALNPDLTIRFEFVSNGKFSTPVFSQDGTAVYTSLDKILYAISTETGEQLWQVTLKGNIHAQPAVDAQGNIIIGSDGKDLLILTPNGQITTRLRLNDKFGRVISSSLPDDQMMVLVGDKNLLTIGRLPDRWNPDLVDVQPAEIKDEWEIVNTISIDIGADQVHNTAVPLPDEDGDLVPTNITGAGVTIAVIDSGVYVDKYVKDLLSSDLYATDLQQQYLGQFDFVGDGQGPGCKINEDYNAAEGYCYYDWDKSRDPYGHGSHVAGIIWSQITDASTSASMGIAPGANVVSVRVLGNDGMGTYEDVIQGIQWVVENQNNPDLESPIRVMNLSLSAEATVPYFVDPINRAVEQAWASGIVVLAAAGNVGPAAQTITVPGNDPYIITVGAINNKRTPGYWADDEIPQWSASGPTLDGFIKPDVLAPGAQIISFMHNDEQEIAQLLQDHPDYSETMSLFRMNGTSMATAVTSGVVALMLEVEPDLTPDQVKYRLMASAKPMITEDGSFAQSMFQQGMGRIWVPDAVLWNDEIPSLSANQGMDIEADLANPWLPGDDPDPATNASLAYHYMGPVQHTESDDGSTRLYFTQNPEDGTRVMLGAVDVASGSWLDYDSLIGRSATSGQGDWVWNNGMVWAGGYMYVNAGGYMYVGAGEFGWMAPGGYMYVGADGYMYVNAGGYMYVNAGGYMYVNAGGYMYVNAGGYMYVNAGGYMYVNAGGYMYVNAGGYMYVGADSFQSWASNNPSLAAQSIGANKWVDDDRPEGFTVHIADLDGAASWVNKNEWQQVVTVTTRDEFQSRISNATVVGNWSSGGSGSCVTNDKGECTIYSNLLTAGVSSIAFTVTDVQHETLPYVPADNLDLDGDSTGTQISASKPVHPTVSVNDIDAVSEWINSSAWSLEYSIAVVDNENVPVPNATLTAKWSRGLSGTFSCTTDAEGLCVIPVESIADSISEVELEVLGIDHWLLNYNKDANTDVDGGSNGTKLKVYPPTYRPTLHVADLDAATAWVSSSAWRTEYTITIQNDLGQLVSDATVNGIWKSGLSGSFSCTTDAGGQCTIQASPISENVSKVEIEIGSVAHAMLFYNEDLNDDPDNDSDGTKLAAEPPDYRPGMTITAIAGSGAWLNSSSWMATVTFTVLDDNQQPVADAVITSRWTKGISGYVSCTTDSNGQCTVSGIVAADQSKAELEILSVTHSMLVDNEGLDSISVIRP